MKKNKTENKLLPQKKETRKKIITTLIIINLIITVLIISLINAQKTAAAEGDGTGTEQTGCCLSPSGPQEINQQECTSLNGAYYAQSCSEIPEAVYGCCCEETTPGTYVGQGNYKYICDDAQGKFFPNYENCDKNFCEKELSTTQTQTEVYNITGHVKDSQGRKIKANLTLWDSYSGTKVKNTTYDGTNSYKFTNIPPGAYSISYWNETCQDNTVPFTLTENTEINLTLDLNTCTPRNGETRPGEETNTCQVAVWDCEWDNPEQQCGRARNCKARNESNQRPECCSDDNCPEATNKPPVFILCAETFSCEPNGQLDPGEECDPGTDYNSPIFGEGPKTCEELGYNGGNLYCTEQCVIDDSNCATCPTNPADCTSKNLCGVCEVCDETPACQQDNCEYKEPTIESLELIPGTDQAKIIWSLELDAGSECEQALTQFIINQKEESGCQEECTKQYLIPRPESETNTFQIEEIISGLKPETTYSYNITAIYVKGNKKITNTSETQQITEGNQECMNPLNIEKEFCLTDNGQQKRVKCEEDNTVNTIEDCGEQEKACFGPLEDGTTTCQEMNSCTLCNGLYGMYSHLNLLIPFTDKNGAEIMLNCEQINQPSYSPTPVCYQTITRTSINKYDSCSEIKSCYDYEDQNSCETNPCENELTNNCEWKPLDGTGTITGKGVCRPKNVEEQDCSRCDETKILADGCNQQLCGLYGECYYGKTLTEEDACMKTNTIACRSYQTKEECIGTQGINVLVDVTYNETTGEIISGTHQKISLSQDKYGLGVCQWDEQSQTCFKNSNNLTKTGPRGRPLDDCEETGKQKDNLLCYSDNETPKTTILLPSPQMQEYGEEEPVISTEAINNLIQYSVKDNVYDASEIETFFSVTPTKEFSIITNKGNANEELCGQYEAACSKIIYYNESEAKELGCQDLQNKKNQLSNNAVIIINCSEAKEKHPNKELEEIKTELITKPFTGKAKLSWYSKDPAQNLEAINETTIIMDSTPPIMTSFKENTRDYNITPDRWFTDLTIEYTIIEEHGPTICEANLTKTGGIQREYGGDKTFIFTEKQKTLTQEYKALSDGKYEITITCQDDVGNKKTYKKTITLNADKSITIKEPTNKLVYKPGEKITIKLETQKSATCYYSEEPKRVTNMGKKLDESNDKKTHNTTISYESGGLRIIYFGCRFEDGRVIEGMPGDEIVIGIDNYPPTATLTEAGTEAPFKPLTYQEERTMKITCNDNNPELRINDENYLSFGKPKPLWCVYSLNTPNRCDYQNNKGNFEDDEIFSLIYDVLFNQLSDGPPYYIKYACQDAGGNLGEFNTTELYIKDLNFEPPIITVITGKKDITLK